MPADLTPTAAPAAPCKCCGTPSPLFGVVDFNKHCDGNAAGHPPLGLSGVPVYYHRCPRCGFSFTTAFDAFSPDDFARHIYNDRYVIVDPQYLEIRPARIAKEVAGLLPDAHAARILDYGGGNGVAARRLRDLGFSSITVYDPFVPEFSARPAGPFDCVICFEVLEHTPDPAGTFGDIAALLADDGLVIFTTLLQPAEFVKLGPASWWYAAPRNGHVSLYTRDALNTLAARVGLTLASFNETAHLAWRTPPRYGRHLLSRVK